MILGIIAAAGLAVQVYGQINSANAQANAQQREAAMKERQAQELESRQAINERLMMDKEAQAELSVGNDNGSQRTSLGGILSMRRDLRANLETSHREATWKAEMLRLGGAADMSLASDIQTAGVISGVGTALTGSARIYSSAKAGSKPSTDTKDLAGAQS